MVLDGNGVLITGGGTGLGLALAERFLKAGSEVLVCGRREDRLKEAARRLPGLRWRAADLARPGEREALADWAFRECPRLNVLVNNAGIQRRIKLAEAEPWTATSEEIAINLESPIHLSRLFIPGLLKQARPAIVNVTSGLAFVPLALAPIYSATKAAMHSFTLSLRRHLAKTPIQVIEIAPPALNTDLGGAGLHLDGTPVGEFADAVFEKLKKGELEIAYGFSEKTSRASREELDQIFQRMNQSF